jgi:hypothetical protein
VINFRVPLKFTRGVLIIALFWLTLAGFVAVELWPIHPNSMGSWVLFVLLAPPLYLAASGIVEWALDTPRARSISAKLSITHPDNASMGIGRRLMRIGVAIFVGLSLVVLSLAALVLIPKLLA